MTTPLASPVTSTLPRSLLPSIALISATAIGYEVLLMRLLSIIHWHHFAYMIISLALLGYGASGTFIALAGNRLRRQFAAVYTICALAFALAMPVCFLVAQRIPFNALEVVWEPRQLGLLAVLYLVFFVPFFLAATCIGLALTRHSAVAARIYAADLLGAGCGAVLVIAALFVARPQQGLQVLAVGALVASLVSALQLERARHRYACAGVGVVTLLALLGLPENWLALRLSPFKGLSQTLAVIDTRVAGVYSSPLGQLHVVASPTIPFRHVPGLSLYAERGPPEQLAVFTDGDAMSVITRFDGDFAPLRYLAATTAAAPYQLLHEPRVLVLGAGGGHDVLMARYHGAREIDAVELNAQMAALVADTHADFAGGLYDAPNTRVHIGDARAFVAASERQFDLIQMALLDSAAAAGAGVQALNESYLYTVEAIADYLQRLSPGGILAITRWLKLPPRDSLKLFATAIEAMRQSGEREPGRRLILLRGWNTTTLLLGERAFTPQALARMREFSRASAFDIAYLPGQRADEVNRYNVLREPQFHDGASQLLKDPQAYVDRYKFHLAPATDDSPYFFHFFRWRALPELLAIRQQGGAALIEWGYLIVLATLAQALIAGAVLILLPLALSARTALGSAAVRFGGYFFALGLAFLFLEIAFIQKLVLFLGHPLYAVAIVLSGFLVFAGLGSGAVSRLSGDGSTRKPGATAVVASIIGIALLCALYLLALPALLPALIGLADPLKALIALVMIAPLAFCMGMPFPLGLQLVAARCDDFVPWAWGINGFASVLSATLATLLAVEFGFSVLVMAGAGAYVLAVLLLPRGAQGA